MPQACRAPPPQPPCHLMGTSTHQSSSTTRTSTKNVFLLTRFLNVSAKGENFSYVECGLRKAILTQAGMGGGEGYLLPAAVYRALRTCRSPGREAPPPPGAGPVGRLPRPFWPFRRTSHPQLPVRPETLQAALLSLRWKQVVKTYRP